MNPPSMHSEATSKAVRQVAQRLVDEGWEVSDGVRSPYLPPQIAHFEPDLIAHRGGEIVVVEVKSARLPPNLDTVRLAEFVESMPGWRLDLIYVPELPLTASLETSLRRADQAVQLAVEYEDAAVLLVWSAAEGTLHRVAEAHAMDTEDVGALLAAMASLGMLDDAEYSTLRMAWTTSTLLAHGRDHRRLGAEGVQRIAEFARGISQRENLTAPEVLRMAKVRPGAWTPEAIAALINALDRENLVQADVLREAIRSGGVVSRDDVFRVANFPKGRTLRGFTRPTNRIANEMKRTGLISFNAPQPLRAVYDKGPRATSFSVPLEFVELGQRMLP